MITDVSNLLVVVATFILTLLVVSALIFLVFNFRSTSSGTMIALMLLLAADLVAINHVRNLCKKGSS